MRAEGDSDADMAPMPDPAPADGRGRDGASDRPRGVVDHRALFETMPQGVVYQDDAGRIVAANPAAERILGLSLGQMRGHTMVDPHWKATREDGASIPDEEHPARLALRAGRPVRGAIVGIYRPDEAAYRWIAADVTPLVAPGADRPHGVVTVFDDISDRKRAEESLRAAARAATERASELEAALGAMADGVIVYDAEGRTIGDNRALRALLGLDARPDYDRLTIAERADLLDISDEAGGRVAARDLPPARALGGEDVTGPRAMDLSMRTLDGRRVQTNVSAAAVRDGDGRIVGAVAVYRDVTERRRLERRTAEVLDALLAMARTLVGDDEGDGSAATIADVDGAARAVGARLAVLTRDVLGCRRVAITALDGTTGAARPLAAVGMTPDEEEAWRAGRPEAALRGQLDAARLGRLADEGVLVLDAADTPGGALPHGARTVLLALMRAGGQTVGVLALDYGGAAHTYTTGEVALARAVARLCGLVIERERLLREREEARANEAALREANRRMDEFLGIAGHEMRTPLTSVKGNIQVVRRRLEHLDERHEIPDAAAREVAGARDLLRRADAGVARLNRLVDDLLDVSRIQAGRLQIRPEQIDLAALVREVVDEHRALEPARAILVDSAPADAPMIVMADAHRIAQVVTNYLSNALRYAPPAAPITVGLTARAADDARGAGREARVWVRDAGPGLDAVEQGRVWGQFYRVEGVGHQHGSSIGLGLGLYISRTIVEAHGGHVGVESAPGAGATFWFTLPLGDESR